MHDPANIIDRPGFHFDGHPGFETLHIIIRFFNGLFDTAAKIDVVVFKHDHIIQPKAVVGSPAYPDGFLFQQSKIGSGLSCIQQPGMIWFQFFCILPGQCGNAAHTLHRVQYKPFARENRMHPGLNLKRDITRFHGIGIGHLSDKLHVWLYIPKDLLRYIHTRQNPLLFYLQHCPASRRRVYTTDRGMIAIPDVFCQGVDNELMKHF